MNKYFGIQATPGINIKIQAKNRPDNKVESMQKIDDGLCIGVSHKHKSKSKTTPLPLVYFGTTTTGKLLSRYYNLNYDSTGKSLPLVPWIIIVVRGGESVRIKQGLGRKSARYPKEAGNDVSQRAGCSTD